MRNLRLLKVTTLLIQLEVEISFSYARAHIHHLILAFLSSTTGFMGKSSRKFSLEIWVERCLWGLLHLFLHQGQENHVKILKCGFSAKFIFLKVFFYLNDFIYICHICRISLKQGVLLLVVMEVGRGGVVEEEYRNICLITWAALIIKPVSSSWQRALGNQIESCFPLKRQTYWVIVSEFPLCYFSLRIAADFIANLPKGVYESW